MIIWSWQSWQELHSLWVIIIIIIVISIITSWSLSSSQSPSNVVFKSRAVTSTKVQDKRPLSLFSTIIVSFQKLNKARSYPWKTTKIQDLHDINNNKGFNIPVSPGMKQGTSHYVRGSYRSSAAMAQAMGCYERPVLKRTAIHDSTGRTTKGDRSSEGNEIYNSGTCGERQSFVCTKHLSFREICYRWKKEKRKWLRSQGKIHRVKILIAQRYFEPEETLIIESLIPFFIIILSSVHAKQWRCSETRS